MRRRIIRVVPLYFLLTVPWLFIEGIDTERLLTSLTFWPVWSMSARAPELKVGWSLNFEMLFYVAAACVLAWRGALAFVLGLYGLAVAGAVFLDWPVFRFLGNLIVCEFLLGAGIAHLHRHGRLPKLGWPAVALALLLLFTLPVSAGMVFVLPTELPAAHVLMRLICFGAPAALVVAATIQMTAGKSWLTYLGDASYSIYLAHPTALILLAPFIDRVPTDIAVVIGFVLGTVCGLVVHHCVERPLLAHLQGKRRDLGLTPAKLRST